MGGQRYELQKAFLRVDRDRKGHLTFDQILIFLRDNGMAEEEEASYMAQFDRNNDGQIDFFEFVNAHLCEARGSDGGPLRRP